jgi:hypothetical protein
MNAKEISRHSSEAEPTKLKVKRVEEDYIPTEIEVVLTRDGEVRLILTSSDQPEVRLLVSSFTAIALGEKLLELGLNAARIAERDERHLPAARPALDLR